MNPLKAYTILFGCTYVHFFPRVRALITFFSFSKEYRIQERFKKPLRDRITFTTSTIETSLQVKWILTLPSSIEGFVFPLWKGLEKAAHLPSLTVHQLRADSLRWHTASAGRPRHGLHLRPLAARPRARPCENTLHTSPTEPIGGSRAQWGTKPPLWFKIICWVFHKIRLSEVYTRCSLPR